MNSMISRITTTLYKGQRKDTIAFNNSIFILQRFQQLLLLLDYPGFENFGMLEFGVAFGEFFSGDLVKLRPPMGYDERRNGGKSGMKKGKRQKTIVRGCSTQMRHRLSPEGLLVSGSFYIFCGLDFIFSCSCRVR